MSELNPTASAWLAEARRRLPARREILEIAEAVARVIPEAGLAELPNPALLARCGNGSPEDAVYAVNEMIGRGLLTLLWAPQRSRPIFYINLAEEPIRGVISR